MSPCASDSESLQKDACALMYEIKASIFKANHLIPTESTVRANPAWKLNSQFSMLLQDNAILIIAHIY